MRDLARCLSCALAIGGLLIVPSSHPRAQHLNVAVHVASLACTSTASAESKGGTTETVGAFELEIFLMQRLFEQSADWWRITSYDNEHKNSFAARNADKCQSGCLYELRSHFGDSSNIFVGSAHRKPATIRDNVWQVYSNEDKAAWTVRRIPISPPTAQYPAGIRSYEARQEAGMCHPTSVDKRHKFIVVPTN